MRNNVLAYIIIILQGGNRARYASTYVHIERLNHAIFCHNPYKFVPNESEHVGQEKGVYCQFHRIVFLS